VKRGDESRLRAACSRPWYRGGARALIIELLGEAPRHPTVDPRLA